MLKEASYHAEIAFTGDLWIWNDKSGGFWRRRNQNDSQMPLMREDLELWQGLQVRQAQSSMR